LSFRARFALDVKTRQQFANQRVVFIADLALMEKPVSPLTFAFLKFMSVHIAAKILACAIHNLLHPLVYMIFISY